MSKILAIDTATAACSVAILNADQITEEYLLAPQSHTQQLLPLIKSLLERSDVSLSSLDAIALTNGPGSFTGLRIAMGVVQGLAYGADLPVIGISTLQTMVVSAQRLLDLPETSIIIPALDARMNEVYWSIWQQNKDRSLQCIESAKVGGEAALPDFDQFDKESIVGIGDGWQTAVMQKKLQSSSLIVPDFYPRAFDVARLAETALKNGEAKSVFEAELSYIRNEVHWKKRQRVNRA